MLDKLEKALNSCSFVYYESQENDKDDLYAFVIPEESKSRVFLCKKFFNKNNFTISKNCAAGVLLHEVSHFKNSEYGLGLVDKEYNVSPINLDENHINAEINANNLEY